MSRLSSILLLVPALLAAGDVRLEGPPRLYAGRVAERRLAGLPEGAGPVTWRLFAFSAEIARGSSEGDVLRIAVPAAQRRIPGTLVVAGGSFPTIRREVTIHPSRAEELRRLVAGEEIGWIGPGGPPPPLTATPLETPGAVRRFSGRLFLIASGDADPSPLLPALLARAAAGARVVDLGADRAPWVDPEGGAPAGPLARARPLREGDGNHLEARGGLVREVFPGTGLLVLARLRIVEAIETDPLAEERLIDLIERALGPLPALVGPRRVVAGDDRELASLFAADATGRCSVLSADGEDAEERGRKAAPAIVVGADRTVRYADGKTEAGPGLSDRPAFLRYVTGLGLRVRSGKGWRQ